MPPRRSSRISSVEPEAAPPPAPAKRKRSQAPESKVETNKENVAKPASRRRSTSAGPSKPPSKGRGRVASRSKAKPVLEEIGESEGEEDVPVPAEKQDQPAVDSDSDDVDEEEVRPKKIARPSLEAKVKLEPQSTPKKSKSPRKPHDESEEEYEEEHSLLDPPNLPSPKNSPRKSQAAPPAEEPQGPQSRLVIHKIALVNFKSYAGRQEIGPFHKSFSAIVGANGSGKSNTIDALLFVFGYRASKMRQGKLSELIHNSSDYQDLDHCSVEIHFRDILDLPGRDAFEVVPDSTLIVSRTAYKNNSSDYHINGRQSSYKQVQSLLKGRGIDLDHNRFLILQGEVESIAQMKPKGSNEHEDGLLEYLEDIIGTSQYKSQIEEAFTKFEEAQEKRQERLNRLRLVEKEKMALSAKRKEAVDYLKLDNDRMRAEYVLFQCYIVRCIRREEEIQAAIRRIKAEIDEERQNNAADLAHLEELTKWWEQGQDSYEELRTTAADAAKELSAHEKKAVGVEERCKAANAKVKKLKKSVSDDTNALNTARRNAEDHGEKAEKEAAAKEEYEASLQREEEILAEISESLRDKTQAFRDQIQVKQKEIEPWNTKINKTQADINVATSERDTLNKKAEDAQNSLTEAKDTLANLRNEQDEKSQRVDDLKQEKSSIQQEIRDSEQRLNGLRGSSENLRKRANMSRSKLEEAKSSQAEKKSRDRVLNGLREQRDRGKLQGFHGRLGDLGRIDDKYDVAVTTACGALSNMVVDTVQQGSLCIEYLRKNNVGRASFLVLDKLGNFENQMRPKTTPEDAPRLFDLITCKDPKFRPAFYKVMNDTLVAENIEQANRLAFGQARRWRVVTLAGQVIDLSGTMGGGGQPLRGGMSSKMQKDEVSPEVMRSYERESHDATTQLNQATAEIQELEAKLEALRAKGPGLDMDAQKLNMDLATGKKRIADAQQRVHDLQSQTQPNKSDLSRISKLDKDIKNWTAELDGLRGHAGKIEAELKKLEDKIMEIGGSRLKSQQSKVEGLRMQIEICYKEITRAEVTQTKAEKDIKKFEEAIETNSAQLEEALEEAGVLQKDLDKLNSHAAALRDNMESAKEAEAESKQDLDDRKAELDKQKKKVNSFMAREIELTQDLDTHLTGEKENSRNMAHWVDKSDSLELHEIPEDDDDDDDETDDESDGTKKRGAKGEDNVKPDPDGPDSGEPKAAGTSSQRDNRGFPAYKDSEIIKMKEKQLKVEVEALGERVQRLRPDLAVIDEYEERQAEYMKRAEELDSVNNLRDALKAEYDGLRKRRLDEFMAGFNTISLKLKEMYQMITLGGNAELELVDSMDPFSEGIIFSVMPPKKSWKNISNLSGGEKTLSSLALVFALHVFKPTPLYFMDEIDAALDFRNVSIVANYIKDRTKNAQFIIISLRNDMFELSQRLIGIYKTSNTTKSISINNSALPADVQVQVPAQGQSQGLQAH